MTPSFFPMKTWLRHSQRRTLARDGQDSPSRPASCFGTVRRLQTSSRALQHRRTIDDERQGGSGLAGEDHGGDGGAGPQGFPTGAGANPTTSARRLGSRSPRPVVWVIIRRAPPLSVQPPQKTAFLCQAKCTDMRGPQEEFHRCLEQCGQPIARHEQAVMSELQGFQQRCSGAWCSARIGKPRPRTRRNTRSASASAPCSTRRSCAAEAQAP